MLSYLYLLSENTSGFMVHIVSVFSDSNGQHSVVAVGTDFYKESCARSVEKFLGEDNHEYWGDSPPKTCAWREKREPKSVLTMASYACKRHPWWHTQTAWTKLTLVSVAQTYFF